MTVIELLALLNEQGIAVSTEGSDLRVNAPSGTLTDELKALLVQHKSELLELLAKDPAEQTVAVQSILEGKSREALPLSFAQERLWFLDQLEPGNTHYNLPAAISITGALDSAALETALQQLVQRHEALRSVFATQNREPVVLRAEHLTLPLTQHDATVLTEEELQQKLTTLINVPFDLSSGPLLRAHLLIQGPGEHVLLLVAHHIIADGVSLSIVMREMAALYAVESGTDHSALPPLDAEYGDFAAWQREHLSGERLERELDYWRKQLDGAPLTLELPTDHPRPAGSKHTGGWARELFDEALL